MLKSLFTFLAASLALLLVLSVESRPAPTDKSGQMAAVYSTSSFCLLLPKHTGGNVFNQPVFLRCLPFNCSNAFAPLILVFFAFS